MNNKQTGFEPITEAAGKQKNMSELKKRTTRKPSDQAFLQTQADRAFADLTRCATEMAANLTQKLDVRALAKNHPWALVAAAAVSGFAAAAVLTPRRDLAASSDVTNIKEPKPRRTKRGLARLFMSGKRRTHESAGDNPNEQSGVINGLIGGLIRTSLMSFAGHAAANWMLERLTEASARHQPSKTSPPEVRD